MKGSAEVLFSFLLFSFVSRAGLHSPEGGICKEAVCMYKEASSFVLRCGRIPKHGQGSCTFWYLF